MLLHMKRTTLVLDSALYAALKRRAAAEGRTLTDVVERALRLGLSALAGIGYRKRDKVCVFKLVATVLVFVAVFAVYTKLAF